MKRLLSVFITVAIAGAAVFFIGVKPSNDREWDEEFARTNRTEQIDESHIRITNLRNWRYSTEEPVSFDYVDETYNVNNLERVWFILEPFSKWQAVAHTYFVFDFSDSKESLAFSIEARREKGEKYNGLHGLFRAYELYYFWGTETDFTGRRVYQDDATLYMYPLKLTSQQRINLFTQLARETNRLAEHPRFYNTFSSNCTNELAKAVRAINPDALPWYSVYILPGYADAFLYDRGYIDTKVHAEDLHDTYKIASVVQEHYPNFKVPVREQLGR